MIVLPRSPTSPDVFVAHLGKITVQNTYLSGPECLEAEDLWGMARRERYNIEIRDMNLYSLNVEKKWKSRESAFQ